MQWMQSASRVLVSVGFSVTIAASNATADTTKSPTDPCANAHIVVLDLHTIAASVKSRYPYDAPSKICFRVVNFDLNRRYQIIVTEEAADSSPVPIPTNFGPASQAIATAPAATAPAATAPATTAPAATAPATTAPATTAPATTAPAATAPAATAPAKTTDSTSSGEEPTSAEASTTLPGTLVPYRLLDGMQITYTVIDDELPSRMWSIQIYSQPHGIWRSYATFAVYDSRTDNAYTTLQVGTTGRYQIVNENNQKSDLLSNPVPMYIAVYDLGYDIFNPAFGVGIAPGTNNQVIGFIGIADTIGSNGAYYFGLSYVPVHELTAQYQAIFNSGGTLSQSVSDSSLVDTSHYHFTIMLGIGINWGSNK